MGQDVAAAAQRGTGRHPQPREIEAMKKTMLALALIAAAGVASAQVMTQPSLASVKNPETAPAEMAAPPATPASSGVISPPSAGSGTVSPPTAGSSKITAPT